MSTSKAGRLSPGDARRCVCEEDAILIDVRGFDEFTAEHADGAICIPLADLERRAGEIPSGRPVVCICGTGGRSAMAVERLRALGFPDVRDAVGGTSAWAAASLPVLRQKGVIPLERQVRGIAGAIVLACALLALTVAPGWIYGALFVGFMLFLSGVTGLCPMLVLLKTLPWNRVSDVSKG